MTPHICYMLPMKISSCVWKDSSKYPGLKKIIILSAVHSSSSRKRGNAGLENFFPNPGGFQFGLKIRRVTAPPPPSSLLPGPCPKIPHWLTPYEWNRKGRLEKALQNSELAGQTRNFQNEIFFKIVIKPHNRRAYDLGINRSSRIVPISSGILLKKGKRPSSRFIDNWLR